jgi:hypothetical protein
MELIAERVAAGLDVRPAKARKHNKKHTRASTFDNGTGSAPSNSPDERRQSEEKERSERSVDWKKWGERAAIGKTWAEDGKRLISGHQVVQFSRPTTPFDF